MSDLRIFIAYLGSQPQSLSESEIGIAGWPAHARWRYPGTVGRALIVLGVCLLAIGLALEFAPRLPFRVGRLPGDIYIHRHNTTFYFPIVTCLLVSVVLSLVIWLFNRR